MKLKTLVHLIGLRPRPREYGHEIRTFSLPDDGPIEYAQWLHPAESPKSYTQAEVDHLRTFLAPGDVAIDIGAHTGDTTLPIALAVGPTGRVLALEPNPYVYRVLKVNAGLNAGKTVIEPLPFAATPADGPIEFEYSDPGFCNGGRHQGIHVLRHGHAFKKTVQGRHLESYLREERSDLIPRIRYVKTDAEGYDAAVLGSLRGLLAEVRPYIKAEVYKHTSHRQRLELFQMLRGLGYQVRLIKSHLEYFGPVLDDSQLMDRRHYDILCVPNEQRTALSA
jgi:FkbM family methyltransferase